MQEIFDVISKLNDARPHTKEDCISFFEESSHTLKIIDSHNTQSIIVALRTTLNTYALKIECGVNTATHKEREWYEAARTLELATLYINGYVCRYFACIVMQYLNELYPLSELFSSHAISLESGIDFIDQAFHKDAALFETRSTEVSMSEQFKLVNDKYLARLNEANNYPYLRQLFAQEKLTINGETYDSPAILLEIIKDSPTLSSALMSTSIGLIHGDLHLGNINVENSTMVLLDPKGIELLPLEYDAGKLLQSTHSNYVEIMRDEFTLRKLNNTAYQLRITANPIYEDIFVYLRKKWSKEFLNRSLFMEAMHFITMTPHHASNKSEATALYLVGVIRLNEVIRKS